MINRDLLFKACKYKLSSAPIIEEFDSILKIGSEVKQHLFDGDSIRCRDLDFVREFLYRSIVYVNFPDLRKEISRHSDYRLYFALRSSLECHYDMTKLTCLQSVTPLSVYSVFAFISPSQFSFIQEPVKNLIKVIYELEYQNQLAYHVRPNSSGSQSRAPLELFNSILIGCFHDVFESPAETSAYLMALNWYLYNNVKPLRVPLLTPDLIKDKLKKFVDSAI